MLNLVGERVRCNVSDAQENTNANTDSREKWQMGELGCGG